MVFPFGFAVGGDHFCGFVCGGFFQRRRRRRTKTREYSAADRKTDTVLFHLSDFYGGISSAFFRRAVQEGRVEKSSPYRRCDDRRDRRGGGREGGQAGAARKEKISADKDYIIMFSGYIPRKRACGFYAKADRGRKYPAECAGYFL